MRQERSVTDIPASEIFPVTTSHLYRGTRGPQMIELFHGVLYVGSGDPNSSRQALTANASSHTYISSTPGPTVLKAYSGDDFINSLGAVLYNKYKDDACL